MDKMQDKSLSVVIPSYCPKEDLFNCLESVHNQSITRPYEVIVVDSSPQDPTSAIHDRFPDVCVIHLKQRTLSGKARSTGAVHASGDIVFFTDIDCIVDHDWMERLLEGHVRGYKVVGGSVVNGTPQSYVGTAEYLIEFNEVNPWAPLKDVRALPSCNLSVQREIFDSIGYFPDFLKGEDTLFCENIILSGEKILFDPAARITHMNRTLFIKYVKNQIALGEGAVEARRRAALHGNFLVSHPYLLPIVPMWRTFMIGKRFLISHWRLVLSYLKHYPLLFIGLWAHVWGFVRGPYRSGLSTEKRLMKGAAK
ncbi:glycosyltransferase [bacterium]|nr:glycosyltransferase [bacterium]